MAKTAIDYDRIRQVAESYKEDMVKFLRDLIRIPGRAAEEEAWRAGLKKMEKLGYDKVEFDQLGNVLGWMGTGDRIIAYDGYIDTVGIGEITNWKFDPTRAMRMRPGRWTRCFRSAGRCGVLCVWCPHGQGPGPDR